MIVIGHRGAPALAPENTLASIKAAVNAGADMVEFDVQLTSDGRFVVMHDSSMLRTTGDERLVSELTLQQIKQLRTLEGHEVPTLDQTLAACADKIPVIEGKGIGWGSALAEYLKKYTGKTPIVISYSEQDLITITKNCPGIETYIVNKTNAFAAIKSARQNGFTGIDLIHWLYSPLVYRYAKHTGLKMITFTVRSLSGRLFNILYPDVMLTTNEPHLLKRLTETPKA